MAFAKSVPRAAPPRFPVLGRAVLLVVAIALAYANSIRAPFLFDDAVAVVDNPTIRRIASLDVLRPPPEGGTTTGRPMVNLSFAINYAVSGDSAWSYHVVNVAIHALAALILFGLIRRTLISVNAQPATHNASAFLAALLWALHPLQTESVVCVAQRTETLCGLFYLLTLYGFVRATTAGPGGEIPFRWKWGGVSVVACLAGMGTKEVMATAPLIVLLYDRTFVAGGFAGAWRERRSYYLALATTWVLLGWLVLQSGGARGVAAGFGLGVSSWSYLLKQCEALVLYARLTFWPHPLVLDYGTAVVHSLAEVWWQGLAVVAALAGTGWALWRRPVVGFAGAWVFLILAPSSSVVPLVTQTMAEHRMYLPLVAIVVAVTTLSFSRLGHRASRVLGLAAAALATGTIARNHDYRDVVSIWSASVAAYPYGARAQNNLAWALQQANRPAEANTRYALAVELDPRYVSARYNWGVALLEQGRFEEAIVQLTTAVRLAPNHADAHVNLGNALVRAHRAAEAVLHYEHALRLHAAADVHYNLGVALADLDRADQAMAQLRAALRFDSAQPEAHFQLGRVLERAGRLPEAETAYTAVLRLAPDHVSAHRRLGLLCARREALVPAAEHFLAVIRLQPADADAHANLGNVLLLQGRPREAIARYEEALRLRPEDLRTLESLRLARESLR